MERLPDRNAFVKVLRLVSYLLPGDFLKTFFYLHFIKASRKVMRKFVMSFYRMDHIYDVLSEFSKRYKGPFAILEFGTANGYSTAKILYATRYLKLEDQVTVHAFDSFEGLREPSDKEDIGLISNDWKQGQYHGNYEFMKRYLEGKRYKNYKIHKGYFEDTLTEDVIELFKVQKPILVWMDCDYYSSTKTVFERLRLILPTGTVFYFDDFGFNFGSRFTGEARLVHEVNQGEFGDNIELLLDRELSLDSRCVYRFIRYEENAPQFERLNVADWEGKPRPIGNGSPMP
jgi:hypothetical protein